MINKKNITLVIFLSFNIINLSAIQFKENEYSQQIGVPIILKDEVIISTDNSIINEGLIFSSGNIYLNFNNELINGGTILARGSIFINGKIWNGSTSYGNGILQQHLDYSLFKALESKDLTLAEALLPKGFTCCHGMLIGLNDAVEKKIRAMLLNAKSVSKETMLMTFVLTENQAAIEWLLSQKEIDVNIQSDTGNTALHYAIMVKNAYIYNVLVNHRNINIHKHNALKQTSKTLTIESGDLNLIKLLKESISRKTKEP